MGAWSFLPPLPTALGTGSLSCTGGFGSVGPEDGRYEAGILHFTSCVYIPNGFDLVQNLLKRLCLRVRLVQHPVLESCAILPLAGVEGLLKMSAMIPRACHEIRSQPFCSLQPI